MAKKKVVKKKKAKRKTRSIVVGHLEKISAKVFTAYSKVITDMIKGHQGIYALYKNNRLYYVGKASNLKGRIKQHLNDKHKGQWTHFSLYIIRKSDHIKEIESMILRIAYPKGTSVKGKLRQSVNLLPELNRQVKISQDEERTRLLGKRRLAAVKASRVAQKQKLNKSSTKKDKPLKGYFPGGKCLYAIYKGKDYKAWVTRAGTIKLDGKLFDSPSTAAETVRGAKTNGWAFWKVKDKNGNLVKLKTLRK